MSMLNKRHRIATLSAAILGAIAALPVTAQGASAPVVIQTQEIASQALQSGQEASTDITPGEWHYYYIDIAQNATELKVEMKGDGDTDLYIRHEAEPDTEHFDYRPWLTGSDETVVVTPNSNPQALTAGRWYIAVSAYRYSNYTLVATTDAPGNGGAPDTTTEAQLFDEQTVNNAITTGAWTYYYIDVPEGANILDFTTSGDGDVDMYIRYGEQPTLSQYDQRPYLNGSNESASIAHPQAGRYWVGIYGYSGGNYSLVADHDAGESNGTSTNTTTPINQSNIPVAQGEWQHWFVDVPVGATNMTIAMTGTGDADLYVLQGNQSPTENSWDYRPYLTGSNETVNVTGDALTPGRWAISIYGYTASKVDLEVTIKSLAQASEGYRAEWLQQELYRQNHDLAAQLPGEVTTKMTKMAESPFAFFRGTAHIFYQDMKNPDADFLEFSNDATNHTWIGGDMHMQNTGAFVNRDGTVVFDVNDYDEGYWGSYLWDLRRMAASIYLVAEENGLGASAAEAATRELVEEYLKALRDFDGNSSEEDFQLTSSNTSGEVKDDVEDAEDKSTSKTLDKYTEVVSGRRQFKNAEGLSTVNTTSYNAIASAMPSYMASIPSGHRESASYYQVKDIKQKTGSGVGSLGRYRYYVLIEGPTSSNDDDVILEIKQETESAVTLAVPGNLPATTYGNNEGQRAFMTAKAQMNNTNPHLGYTTIGGQDFFVREKLSLEEDFDYTELNSASKLKTGAKYMGQVLAKMHALSDKDYGVSDYNMEKEILNVIGNREDAFSDALVNFASNYSAQVKLDYQAFQDLSQNGSTLY